MSDIKHQVRVKVEIYPLTERWKFCPFHEPVAGACRRVNWNNPIFRLSLGLWLYFNLCTHKQLVYIMYCWIWLMMMATITKSKISMISTKFYTG